MLIRLLIVLLFFSSCAAQKDTINGVSFVAAPEKANPSHIDPVIEVGANYTAIMPFGFIRNLEHPEIIHNTDRQWFGETRAGAHQYIDELRKKNIRIMLKPQIWVSRGEFTGFIEMTNEDDWSAFENSYSNFILEFAEVASSLDIEIFCIGTELEKFIKNRPEYWFNLIKEIKKVYKGKLTYAANWDEFKRTPFWDQLDFIGLDAYFPVSNEKTPSLEDCMKGWAKPCTCTANAS